MTKDGFLSESQKVTPKTSGQSLSVTLKKQH
jgi:hypothetical protein